LIYIAEESVNEVIRGLINTPDLIEESEKVKNKFEASTVFSNTNILNKAISLSYYELLGNPELMNREISEYRKVTPKMAAEATEKYFTPENCSTLYYKSTRND
jgi:zinc protease